MSKLIAVVGNTGAGKTTLVRALCQHNNFVGGLEQHAERPFQMLFKMDQRFAFANQIDYLLQRAIQEYELRQITSDSLVDGGLDLDFHGFTRLFHVRGFITDVEFTLCKDIYTFCRSVLPLPELIIHLIIDHDVITKRLANRERISIATPDDLDLLDVYLDEWLATLNPDRVFQIDVTTDDLNYSRTLPHLLDRIRSLTID
jgi:deoxyadenosine/deoxycytidine kinase